LLVPVLRAGQRVLPATDLGEARRRCLEGLDRLPEHVVDPRTGDAAAYPVRYSSRLDALLDEVRRRVERAARI